MGKGDKPRRAKIPGLQAIPARKKRGRSRQQEIDTDQPALKARARQMGKNPNSSKARAAMRSPEMGEEAGQALCISEGQATGSKLFGIYKDMTAAEQRYATVVLGCSLHAKTAKIEMTPERFETRADDRPDHRSETERILAAHSAWNRWKAIIVNLQIHEQRVLQTASRGLAPLIILSKNTPTLTQTGREFVTAMKALAKIDGTF